MVYTTTLRIHLHASIQSETNLYATLFSELEQAEERVTASRTCGTIEAVQYIVHYKDGRQVWQSLGAL